MQPGRRQRVLVAAVLAVAAVAGVAPGSVPAQSERGPVEAAAVHASATVAASAFELHSAVDRLQPVRWLACRAIDVRVNPAAMPAGMVATVRHTLAVLSEQTGVRFRYAGATTHTFTSTAHAPRPTVYVAFTGSEHAAGQTFGGAGGEVGVGGPVAAWRRDGSGHVVESVLYGRVLLSTRFHGARTGAGATWQSLLLHEIGHTLNLAHRGGPSSVMHPALTAASPGRFTAAEVRALRQVLQTTGCDYGAWSQL